MTHEELERVVSDLSGEVSSLRADVSALRVEVARGKDMIQQLSESHDLNRRELQAATKRATELATDLEVRQLEAQATAKDLIELKEQAR